MRNLNQWREDVQKQEKIGGNADFSWLRYFFDTVRETPPGSMVNLIKPKVEGLKDEYAKIALPAKHGAEFKDLSADLAKGFAIQTMAAVLKILMPKESGSGRSVNVRAMKGYMGEEGDQFSYLKRVLGNARMVVPGNIISRIRVPVENLRNKFAEKYGIHDWNENIPEVKAFVLDMLAAVLKTVFPAAEASGSGKTVNFRKIGDYTQKPKTPTREPEQSMQPPEEMTV